jgi:predicted Kef-type K+ transport protein
LIVSAAVIDDMVALVILSQLEALTGEITVSGILIPVISALAFLIIGGYCAIFVLPPLINKHILTRFEEHDRARVEMVILILMIIVLMPATYYAQASYLMGAFIAGLTFCSSHGLHALFVRQFKRVLQWLMRIFFACSIGFQVPIKDFGDGKVIWQGCVFALALFGKVAVGFMVPNFTQSRRFTLWHLRDCLITGFSMAAEGEFAFVLAVFAVEAEIISKDLYASVVLAVLISTIIPPFLLRFTISYYNKKGEEAVKKAAEEEEIRKHDLDVYTQTTGASSTDEELVQGIKNQTTVFLCIQTQSESKWGLLHALMGCMTKVCIIVRKRRLADHPRSILQSYLPAQQLGQTEKIGYYRSSSLESTWCQYNLGE